MHVNRHVMISLHNLRAIGVYLRQPLVACSSAARKTRAKAVGILLKQEKFSRRSTRLFRKTLPLFNVLRKIFAFT